MNETIRKFLDTSVSSKSMDSFNANTNLVKAFISEMEKVERAIKELDVTNAAKCNKLINDYKKLKDKYDEVAHLLEKNQEVFGRLKKIEKDIANISEVGDFGVRLSHFKSRLNNPINLDDILSEFESIKDFYEKNEKSLSKNETIVTEYGYISEIVNYIKTNLDYLKSFVEDAKNLIINDENYTEVYEKFTAHKEKLESLYDELYLTLVDEVVFIVSAYPTGLESSLNLVNKIEFLLDRIDKEEWHKHDYSKELRNQLTTITEEYNIINLNSKPYIKSDAYLKCQTLLEKLSSRIVEVERAIETYEKLKRDYSALKHETEESEIISKRDKLMRKFDAFAEKDHFPALKAQIENLSSEITEIIQTSIVNAIQSLRGTIRSNLTVSTLQTKKATLQELYAKLDEEHKKLVDYNLIMSRINRYIKKRKAKDKHSPYEFVYLAVVLLAAGFLVGFLLYSEHIGAKPLKWLFDNPPYFGHSWEHWGLVPWKWVESIKIHDLLSWLLMVLVFIVSVICMLLFLIGEFLWLILSNLGYGIAWVVLTLCSLILHLLVYAFPAVVLVVGWAVMAHVKKTRHIKGSFTFVLSVFLLVAMTAISYLIKFGIVKWW